jgi:hypothetical protein
MPYPWAIIDKWTSSLVSKIGEEIEHSKKTTPTEIGQATHAKYSRRTAVSSDRAVFTNAPQGSGLTMEQMPGSSMFYVLIYPSATTIIRRFIHAR